MARRGLAALIVPTADPHNSEYVAEVYNRRARLCGFKGSAGTCVVTDAEALLWTDGRYWLEAEATLFEGWTLMKDRRADPANVPPEKWLQRHLPDNAKVGVDPYTFTERQWKQYVDTCGLRLEPTGPNLVDEAEGVVASPPTNPVFQHLDEFAGQSVSEKVANVSAKLMEHSCDIAVYTALDEVAWLLNWRGADVPYNMVFYAYAVVDATTATAHVFLPQEKVLAERFPAGIPPSVKCHPYTALPSYLETLAASVSPEGDSRRVVSCAVDPAQASRAVVEAIRNAGVKVCSLPSVVNDLKAIKNETERRGFVQCHIRDGVALTRYLAWLDDAVRRGQPLTEVSAATKLEGLRKETPYFLQLSFETISGSGANGAIIHHRPDPENPAPIDPNALYLCDSGGHYNDGTTDVTRTVCFRPATAEEKDLYTRVLQGHIALNSALFPAGTAGTRLDCLARRPLWGVGLDYAHGTGHGVGHALNVHEGPHGIGVQPTPHNSTLQEHMIVSNEPGCYRDGKFGIRIENLELLVRVPTAYAAAEDRGSTTLTMQSLTMAPLCRDLIDVTLLSPSERRWVDTYHNNVKTALLPVLDLQKHELDALTLKYVEYHCAPLPPP